jgi:hypothetical protein
VEPFIAAVQDHPYSAAITAVVLGDDDPVLGPLVLHRLASDREAARTVYTAPSPQIAILRLGELRAAIHATRAPKPAPPTITPPPATINPVGGSALPSAGDPTQSLASWRKYKQAQGWDTRRA